MQFINCPKIGRLLGVVLGLLRGDKQPLIGDLEEAVHHVVHTFHAGFTAALYDGRDVPADLRLGMLFKVLRLLFGHLCQHHQGNLIWCGKRDTYPVLYHTGNLAYQLMIVGWRGRIRKLDSDIATFLYRAMVLAVNQEQASGTVVADTTGLYVSGYTDRYIKGKGKAWEGALISHKFSPCLGDPYARAGGH